MKELLEFSRFLHVIVIWEEVHVPEGVNGDQGQVRQRLAQVVQGVLKPYAISREEVYVLWKFKLQYLTSTTFLNYSDHNKTKY